MKKRFCVVGINNDSLTLDGPVSACCSHITVQLKGKYRADGQNQTASGHNKPSGMFS